MDGPPSDSAYRLSCGVVVVRETDLGYRFLMLRAYRHWDFPKGMLESGEMPLEAAIREVAEETTLTGLEFRWGHSFQETGPYNRGKVARYYLAATALSTVHLPVNPALGRPEHSEFRWVAYPEAMDLASPRLKPIVTWAANVLGTE